MYSGLPGSLPGTETPPIPEGLLSIISGSIPANLPISLPGRLPGSLLGSLPGDIPGRFPGILPGFLKRASVDRIPLLNIGFSARSEIAHVGRLGGPNYMY